MALGEDLVVVHSILVALGEDLVVIHGIFVALGEDLVIIDGILVALGEDLVVVHSILVAFLDHIRDTNMADRPFSMGQASDGNRCGLDRKDIEAEAHEAEQGDSATHC
jgi:hypothetical protein